jgi:hypothetical protein
MARKDRLRKAPSFGTPGLGTPATKEPSRWHTNTPGHFPTFSTHKARARAKAGFGEAQALVVAVNKLFRTQDEFGDPPPHVITVQDVTRGIVIDPVDQEKIQKLVTDTPVSFDSKMQTQRIFHARGRLHEALRHSYKHLDSDTRMEVIKRAMAYWRRNNQTDYGREPTIRWGKSMKLIVPMQKARKAHGGKYAMRVVLPDGRLKYFADHSAYERWCDANQHEPHVDGERKLRDAADRRGQALVSDGPPQATTYGYDKLEDEVTTRGVKTDLLQAKMSDADYAELGAALMSKSSPRIRRSALVRDDLKKHTQDKLVFVAPKSRKIRLEW